MAKMGRPRKEISQIEFEKLCGIQCTEMEICGWFGISDETLNRWCKATYNSTFVETYKKFSQDGKISLRRMQLKLAEHNASMAIWLGKQYLGQRDIQEGFDSESLKAAKALLGDVESAIN